MPLRRWRAFAGNYQQALYVVRLPRGEQILRAGQRDLMADRRLWREAGVRKEWIMLSAANPHSRPLHESWNTQRFNQLKKLLSVGNHHLFHSVSRDPKSHWADEHGFFICGIPMRRAMTLGRRLGQSALLAGGPGRRPKIVWI